MCGIAGIISLKNQPVGRLEEKLRVMNQLQAHRGPDGKGTWQNDNASIGLAHRRLSIIDLTDVASQPMHDESGNCIAFNGEIYNYIELREQLKGSYTFKTHSDTEVILAAYAKWGEDCVNQLRGMFAFAIWNESKHELFCARDRFGIKPFYYAVQHGVLYFASETKTILPFLEEVVVDTNALKDYLIFQFTLAEKTLFKNIKQLLPAHRLTINSNGLKVKRYWEINYELDWNHDLAYFQNGVRELMHDSAVVHLRSDVPVGAYLSGGIDSSLMAILGRNEKAGQPFMAFNGRFTEGKEYDESEYARVAATQNNMELHIADITMDDFISNIKKVIYHLDYPTAGPGSFPQYMVSKLASKHRKVVLGGQGGDEVFGGYARYLLAYFEQCIKGAIEGTMNSGNFVVTYESIIPNLQTLKEYVPLMKEFWSDGLFESLDQRYFKLINRSNTLKDEIDWNVLESYSAFDTFKDIFWGNNVSKESYFDRMTHFDFKTLLPALLQVEDRMSMAHGLESRVPILDHPLVEFVATAPANIKFENGKLKHLLKTAFSDKIPAPILNRKDKMGFPVPFTQWYKGGLREFLNDTFNTQNARQRFYFSKNMNIEHLISGEHKYSRKIWGLLSLEIWQQTFIDKITPWEKISIPDKELV